MAFDKQSVIAMIERMPDDATLDDVIHELYFRIKVDNGLRQLDNGESISDEEVRQRLSKWLSS